MLLKSPIFILLYDDIIIISESGCSEVLVHKLNHFISNIVRLYDDKNIKLQSRWRKGGNILRKINLVNL